ncbi:MAG: hypothetical protein ACW99F_17220 [Candidatus Hodarchaeales archaeon]|jgi:hypothetical protein
MSKTQRIFKEAYGYRNALNTKLHGQAVRDLHPLWMNTPEGQETLTFEKGQTVVSTGLGTIKKGVEFEIEDVMNNNGYFRYFAQGQWHNQEDIRLA